MESSMESSRIPLMTQSQRSHSTTDKQVTRPLAERTDKQPSGRPTLTMRSNSAYRHPGSVCSSDTNNMTSGGRQRKVSVLDRRDSRVLSATAGSTT